MTTQAGSPCRYTSENATEVARPDGAGEPRGEDDRQHEDADTGEDSPDLEAQEQWDEHGSERPEKRQRNGRGQI